MLIPKLLSGCEGFEDKNKKMIPFVCEHINLKFMEYLFYPSYPDYLKL